jgi:hypothetical protein
VSFLVKQPESITSADITSPDHSRYAAHLQWLKSEFEAYMAYLTAIRHRLPSSVYDFAVADWHYDFTMPQCPHDAWVQDIHITETAGTANGKSRGTQIEIILLGAYHDRLLKLLYLDVRSYAMRCPALPHGDWVIDEIRLSEAGHVVHEIEFRSGSILEIECRDILFSEELIVPAEAAA